MFSFIYALAVALPALFTPAHVHAATAAVVTHTSVVHPAHETPYRIVSVRVTPKPHQRVAFTKPGIHITQGEHLTVTPAGAHGRLVKLNPPRHSGGAK